MKKAVNTIINILLIICLSVCLFSPVKYSYAEELTPENYGQPGDTGATLDNEFVKKYAGDISSLMYLLAVIIAVICVMFVGIKYITAGVARKSRLQKRSYSDGIRCYYSCIPWYNFIIDSQIRRKHIE